MLNRGIIRLLLPCGALIFALAAPASHPVFAQSPSSTQTEVPPDVKAYRAAMRLEDPQQRIDALEQFLNDFPQSRYAITVHNLILDLLIKGGEAQKERVLAQANQIIDNAPENGKSQACHTIAAKFVVAGILLDEAEVFSAKAISTFNESKFLELQRETYRSRGRTPPPESVLLRGFNSTRATYLATLGQVYLKKGRDAEAERTFKEARKASPSLVTAMIGLAMVKAKAGDNAKAIEMMTEVALSGRMTADARQLLEELYRKTHQDSPDGLEGWLDEQYRRAFPNPLHVKPYKPRSSRTDRVVLAEVFTGAGCPPCVGADLAFDAALERYQRRDVAVLIYHLHIPRPDPMTNAATQSRASFYAVRGVPSYRIDGQAGGGGGSREQTAEIYDRFNPRIERQLEAPSQAEIKLETALDGGIVKVRATVERVEGQSSSLKLHLALVENMLRYNGENGVRFHPMVVRDLAGPGASGFRLRATQPMTFEHAFDLARLTSDLKAQLDGYEQRNPGFKFAEKKHTLDAGALSVVAFVQDEASLHILQSSHSVVKPGAMQLKAPQSELAGRPTTSASVEPVEPKGENPITWKMRTEASNRPLKAGDTFTVQITAQIAAGWHLYAPEQAAGGPRPTRLSLPAEQTFKLAGEVESPPPRTAFDENFGIETAFYETSVNFSAPVRIAGDAPEGRQQLRIQAYFQTCNDRLCLPPRTIQLASPIEIGEGKSPSENKPENKPDSPEPATPINEIGPSPDNGPAGDDAPEEPSRASARNESLRQEIARRQAELRRWSNSGNARWEAETYHHLGAAHFSLGEKGRALDYYQQSLQLWRTLKDRKGEGRTLNNIGWTRHSSGDLRQALDYYQQALLIRRSAGDREGEIQTLYNLGRLHGELSQYEQAISHYQQALALRQAQGDRVGKADAFHQLGHAYDESGDKMNARDSFRQSLQLWQAMGKRRDEAHLLNHLGAIHSSLGEKQQALEHYQQSLQASRAAQARDEESRALNRLGGLSSSLGEKQKALDYYQQSLQITRTAKDQRGEVATLLGLGGVHNSIGEWQQALDAYGQALRLSRAINSRREEAHALHHLGLIYSALGDRDLALSYYRQALQLRRATGERRDEAQMLSRIGRALYLSGERQPALDQFNQALKLYREIKDRQGEASTLNQLGLIYNSLGDRRQALEHFDQSLQMTRAIGARHNETHALIDLGALHAKHGARRQALDYLSQALQLIRAEKSPTLLAQTLHGVGEVYDLLGERQSAFDLYQQGLKLAQTTGLRDLEAAMRYHLARDERDRDRLSEARAQIEAALEIVESLRGNVTSPELRATYFASTHNYHEFYVDLLMRIHSRRPEEGFNATALQASERARARSLLDSLTESRIDLYRGVAPSLLARKRALQHQINSFAAAQFEAFSDAHLDEPFTVDTDIQTLITQYQEFETQIRRSNPRYATLVQPVPLSVRELQQQTLDADTLLLEYLLGAERSYLWAVTHTSVSSFELPGRAEIETLARRVYDHLTKRPLRQAESRSDEPPRQDSKTQPDPSGLRLRDQAESQAREAAASLSRMLLGPVAELLGKKRLLIVADGALQYLPFAALPDPVALKRVSPLQPLSPPLVVEHEVISLPSASTLAVLRRELAGRKPAAKTLAVLADPVFSKDDERVKTGARRVAQQPPASNPGNESLLQLIVKNAIGEADERRLPRLPFTRYEAEQISALVAAGERMQALDFEASRAMAMSDQMSQYRYVHFATHGVADSERAELSTLVLSLFDEQGKPQEGFLRMHEIYNLNLPAELVTLSACDTGLGKQIKGEGLVSLARGFMYAGAARVMVSLWNVNDRATAELMTRFYRKALVDGERPAAALRQAQIEMWRDKRWEDPYFWAAFTLQGEWR